MHRLIELRWHPQHIAWLLDLDYAIVVYEWRRRWT